MGYQERDYYRDEDGPQDPLGLRAMSVTAKLIIVTVLVYLVDLFFGGDKHQITQFLKLHADLWPRPWEYYQFLSYGFAHDPSNIQHILGNMLGLWIFGRLLEEKLGGPGLVRYYLCAIVFCGLVWAARHYFMQIPSGGLIGASGGVVACIILYCVRNPHATMLDKVLLPVPAWVVGALFVALDLFGVELRKTEGNTAFDAHLAGAAFAVLVWALRINFGYGSWFDVPGRYWRKVTGWFKGRPNLRVHSDSAYNSRNDDDDDDLEDEADRILAKISSQGDGSLTAKERRTLEQYSRFMREKRK
jgi:membrane associated rhomboid family serine protease